MKDNYEKCILGKKCVLVPYRPEHVTTYHEWMKSPDLLQATGSEPLSLEEEISMQQSWRDDPTKCTFIVLSKESCASKSNYGGEDDDDCNSGNGGDDMFVARNLAAMVGDVNLFIGEEEEEYNSDDDDDDNQEIVETDSNHESHLQAEIDIMIAESKFRGKGIGKEATCLMMQYGATYLHIRRFYCKINEDNVASISLFQSLGFQQCNYAECFKQVELELKYETANEMASHIETQLLKDVHSKHISCPLQIETMSSGADVVVDPIIRTTAEALQNADYVLLLAGAGFSADSGLATYETMPDEYKELCDPLMLVKDPLRFQQFWVSFAVTYSKTIPHKGYDILDKWFSGGHLPRLQRHQKAHEEKESLAPDNTTHTEAWWVYTSNVDGHFHRYKSFQNQVCEIHGNANEFRCSCGMGLDNGHPRKGVIWQRWNEQVTSKKDTSCNDCAAQVVRVGSTPCNLHKNNKDDDDDDKESQNDEKQQQQQLLLTCTICDLPLRPNVLMFHDTDFNVLQSINKQRDRYQAWEAQMEDDVVLNGKNLVILEFGCGVNVPAVRNESEEVFNDCLARVRATKNDTGASTTEESYTTPSSSNVTLVRINPKDAGIHDVDVDIGHHVLSIYDTSLQAICAINQCLNKT